MILSVGAYCIRPFLLIFIFLFFISTPLNAANQSPSLIIPTLQNKIFDLKDQKGKVVIINFWASWCVNCLKEMKILNEIYKKYQSRGLEIIGVNIEPKRKRNEVSKISRIVFYPNSMLFEVAQINLENPNTIPISYVIGKDGKVIEKISGVQSKEDLEEMLQPLLN